MDLTTKQAIIDRIRPSTREKVESTGLTKFDSDEQFEQFKLFAIRCIELMDDDHELIIETIETGKVELVEVNVNQYLAFFDPIEIEPCN